MTHESFELLLAEYRECGLSLKGFCRERGVNYSTFQYWRRKTRPVAIKESSFLRLVASGSKANTIEIRFPNGASATVQPGFDMGLLREISKALGT